MLITSANGKDSMAMGSLCQRTPLRGIQMHLTAAFFLKVINLEVDEVKLSSYTNSDIL